MRYTAWRTAGAVAGALLLGGAGYLTADAYDVVPGRITLAPVPAPPAPFPTPPGAVEAPPVDAVVGDLDPAAPSPAAAQVTALADDLAANPRLGSSVGVTVTDVLSGEVLADLDGDRPRVPASTTKLLTALAAITALGPDHTLTTRVVQPEPGRLVLVGAGDMMLSAGAGDPEAVNGRAGLVDLAAVTARGLRLAGTAEVRLAVDGSLFTGPALHPGWHADYMSGGYVAPVAALAVDIAGTQDGPNPPRQADPAMAAAQTFGRLLTEQGVTVTGSVTRSTAPADAVELGRVDSAPIRDIVRYAVHQSDNTIAEVLGRLVAVSQGLPGSFQGAARAVVGEVARQGLDTTGTTIADCSGLADGSLIPARLLTGLLALAAGPGHVDLLPVVVDLPVSGWQGTLADRFEDGPARGWVRAKTGSLPGVTSLAGTVQTQDGRQLVFAVMADATPPGGQAEPRAAIDAFVQQLAGCGCR